MFAPLAAHGLREHEGPRYHQQHDEEAAEQVRFLRSAPTCLVLVSCAASRAAEKYRAAP